MRALQIIAVALLLASPSVAQNPYWNAQVRAARVRQQINYYHRLRVQQYNYTYPRTYIYPRTYVYPQYQSYPGAYIQVPMHRGYHFYYGSDGSFSFGGSY